MALTPLKATCRPVPEPTQRFFLDHSALSQTWKNQPAWRILDCEFGWNPRFFETLLAWQLDAMRPRMLHYVGLATQWAGLNPGFHRFSMAQGRVLLTLCVGELHSLLRELCFAADSIYLDLPPSKAQAWSKGRFKALARCCRIGTRLAAQTLTPEDRQALQTVGFELNGLTGTFNPHWQQKTSRQPWHKATSQPGSCIVLGAGLAGASVAASLARRGWQVQVLDAAQKPAAGASSLPVGMVMALLSADNNHRSRISQAGLQMTIAQARALLEEGQDWKPTGLENVVKPHWQAQAAWIKPERLVKAWLASPGIVFRGNQHVTDIELASSGWHLLGANGQLLAKSELLVLASANHTVHLLKGLHQRKPELTDTLGQLYALQAVHGQLSWGWQDAEQTRQLPSHPLHGQGSLVHSVPQDQGLAWYLGATYENTDATDLSQANGHTVNRDRLKRLLPHVPGLFDRAFDSREVQAWQGVRCVSSDRLPRTGAVNPKLLPGLWVNTALGSRGLTYSFLCAELLAAQLMGEPWPLEAKLGLAMAAYSDRE